MYCPVCSEVKMHEVIKQGVLIDVCPKCRGIWLERGELEKILAAGRSEPPDYDEIYGEKQQYRPGHTHHHDHYHGHGHNRGDYKYGDYKHGKHHKKKSFFKMFEEIFD